MKKRYLKRMSILLLIAIIFMVGCTQKQEEDSAWPVEELLEQSEEIEDEIQAEMVSVERLASDIREKYQDNEKYDYQSGIKDLERDEHINLELGFDIEEGERFTHYTQIAAVYQNPELTERMGTHFEWNEEEQILSITPPKTAVAGISNIEVAGVVDGNTAGNSPFANKLFDKGELKDWGNLSQYYLVEYVDLETGEELEKPIVRMVSLKHEISGNLRLKLKINELGVTEFVWNELRGAEEYFILQLNYYPESGGYRGVGRAIGKSEGTSWTPDMPSRFSTFRVSEYERNLPENIEKYGEGTGPILKESEYEEHYCVIAISEDGTSAISNIYTKEELARRIPYNSEYTKSQEEGSDRPDGFDSVPAYKWVTMCDGTLVQRLINFEFSRAGEVTKTWGEYEEEDMSDLRVVYVDVVEIPYRIEGTEFIGSVIIENYDKDTIEEDLRALEERQESLRNRAGSKDLEVTYDESEKPEETKKNDRGVEKTDYRVTANSALSEYLAINMLTGSVTIDLREFPESEDTEYLVDAWKEAVYQNPLILGANGASVSADGESMTVYYDTDAKTMKEKQVEIMAEVKRIVGEVISNDMSELEKELAINAYLCEIAEYDMEALENAEENDFETVDEEFNDSFTPYGVLINGIGVCASYAGAFKLLADAVGLECIVVTGYLNGTLPHAWNKVKIDEEWHVVDTTNNDNEVLFNALLNLSDGVAGKVLVESKDFVLDAKIYEYAASTEEREYYRINGKFFNQEQIVNELAAELQEGRVAVFRTDYMLDDEQFNQIERQVMEVSNIENLNGYHWMGVIALSQ